MATHERLRHEQKYHKDDARSISINLPAQSAINRSGQQSSDINVTSSTNHSHAPSFIGSLASGQIHRPATAATTTATTTAIIQATDHNSTPQANSTTSGDSCHQPAATRGSWFSTRTYHEASIHGSRLRPSTSASSAHTSSGPPSEDGTDDSPTPPPTYHQIPGIVPSYQGRTSGPPPTYDEVVNPNAAPPSYQSLFGQVREARKTSNGLMDLFRQLFLILIGTLGCTMVIGFLLLIPITMILVGIFYVNDCKAENIPSFLVIGGLVWIAKNVLNCYNQFKRDSSTANRPPPRRTPISAHSSSTAASSSSSASTRQSPSSVISISSGSSSQDSSSTTSSQGSARANSDSPLRASGETSSSSTASSVVTAITTTTASSSTSTTTTSGSTTTTTTTTTQGHPVHRIRQPSLIGITSFKCESMLNYFLIVWFMAGCIVVYRIYEPDYENPTSSSYCNKTVYMYAFWLMTTTFIAIAVVLSCLCCLMASSLMSCNHGR